MGFQTQITLSAPAWVIAFTTVKAAEAMKCASEFSGVVGVLNGAPVPVHFIVQSGTAPDTPEFL